MLLSAACLLLCHKLCQRHNLAWLSTAGNQTTLIFLYDLIEFQNLRSKFSDRGGTRRCALEHLEGATQPRHEYTPQYPKSQRQGIVG
jgi:hypothetical protein